MGYCIFKSCDFSGDGMDILDLFKDEPHVFFLDSSLADPARGRFSFIGFDPFKIFTGGGKNSLADLRKEFLPYSEAMREVPSPFFSGMAGYLSYDMGLRFENIKLRPKADGSRLPDCFFGFYDGVIVIDHAAGKLHIFSTGLPEKRKYWRQKRAAARIDAVSQQLKRYVPGTVKERAVSSRGDERPALQCDFTKEEYFQAVRRVLEHIKRGDVYQINLAQKFCFEAGRAAKIDPVEIYRSLRRLSPSSFGAYFDCGKFQIASSSPERFLRSDGRLVSTRPMKGTRPRGKNSIEDKKFRDELFKSRKDKAELLMVTDLERNDLGRVCEYGTVKVREMRTIEEYQTVFQATSTVEGVLREGMDGFDVLKACFPGGSVTGCPKIRAMETIEALEPSRRGLYTGALGYMDFSGKMDFNILIRTLLVQKDKISFHAGSGIVADSTAQKEYDEILVKAQALRACLAEAVRSSHKLSSRAMDPVGA